MPRTYCLEVTGDFACFTRPEMKVERVSYDVITPSAARAVFESILWKPAIRWVPTKIEVLEDQLTGVDCSYFTEVIGKLKAKDKTSIDSAYLVEIIDRMF